MMNNNNNNPHRIHFASCNDQDLENKLWPIIESRNPTAFVWAGDSIYADIETSSSKYNNNDNEYLSMSSTLSLPVLPTLSGTGDVICSTPHRLRALYKNQRNVVGYQNAILNNPNANVTVFGTYDDHDYGCNNADKTYEHKYESGLAFMDFIEVETTASSTSDDTPSKTPTSITVEEVVPVAVGTSNSDGDKQEQDQQESESAMRQRVRAGHGVYGVKLFDFDRPHGQGYEVPEKDAMIDPDIIASASISSNQTLQSMPSYSNMTVAVFVLDVRTNKDPWKTGVDAYKPDYDGDFLGERQWKWFESAIQNSNASVNIIVNGLQVHANIFPDSNIAESWDKFPRSRQRLYDAILQPGVHAPILISGDVHMTQFHRKDCVPNPNKNKGNNNYYSNKPRPLIEMTTSGMTHSWGTLPSPPLGLSNSDLDNYKPSWSIWYEYIIKSNLMIFLHYVCPWKFLMDSSNSEQDQEEIESHTNNDDHDRDDRDRLYPNGGGENSKSGLQYSLEKNFGEIEFDFDLRHVTLRSIGEEYSHSDKPNTPLLMAKISMDQLDGQSYMPGGNHLSNEDFRIEAAAMAAERGGIGQEEGDWICIDHRGRENKLHNIMSYVTTGILLKNQLNFEMIALTVVLFYIVRRLYKQK